MPTEITLKKVKELNPLLVTRTALDIFPVANMTDTPLELLIGTTCRNLLFYELQLLSFRYGIESRTCREASFEFYTSKLATYLWKSDILPMLLHRQSSLQTQEELSQMQKVLSKLPEAPIEAPEEILLIQKLLKELCCLEQNPSESVMPTYQQLTVHWMREQARASMQIIPVETVLNLALHQVRRNLSRHRCGEERRLEWGKEIHDSYEAYLSKGYCAQTAKRLARADFLKAHPIPMRAEDQLSFTPQPGLHRNSIQLYHKIYQESEKNREPQIKERHE